MKKLLFLIFGLLFTHVSMADTINIDWFVDGQTYTQTSCTVGGDIILPTAPTKRGHAFLGWKLFYTPIEYIESTGTQYINTGFKPNQDTRVIMKCLFTTHSGVSLFGARNGGSNKTFVEWHVSNMYRSDYGQYEKDYGNLISRLVDTDVLIDKNKNKIFVETDNGVIVNGSSNYNTFQTDYPLFFPGLNNGGQHVAGSATDIKIYYFQIYDNGTLVRDFIPVLDQHGVPCMYDKVSDTFFYNAGTGDFIAGPVITE